MFRDVFVTMLCWVWFILGYFLFFSWRYPLYAMVAKDPEFVFQRLNSSFFRVLFRIIKCTVPGYRVDVASEVTAIRSAVIVCNHLSYLDPLLLIALFERHRTIAKARFFTMPVFGWLIRRAGYFPAHGEGKYARIMIQQIETMKDFLRKGGNLFVFPEGTRSRDGRVGKLNRGALKIARLCGAPIYVLRLAHTDELFPPGNFFFRTKLTNPISLKLLARVEPCCQGEALSLSVLEQRINEVFSRCDL